MQSKKDSFYEALYNTGLGFCLSYIVALIIYPFFGFNVTYEQNFYIISIFTVKSFVRNYVVRRWYDNHSAYLAMILILLLIWIVIYA